MKTVQLLPIEAADPRLASVLSMAQEMPVEALPALIGRLAEAQALAALRLGSAGRQEPPPAVETLMTAEEVAAMLRISLANVYARARRDLRPAAVEIGPGQLRFDRESLRRLVNARRRG